MTVINPKPISSGIYNSKTKQEKQNNKLNKNEQNDQDTNASVHPIEVKVSVGVSFNGLADWNKFQNQRFETNKQ